MRKYILVLIILVVALCAYILIQRVSYSLEEMDASTAGEEGAEFVAWRTFASPSDVFTVDLPGIPQFQSEVERDTFGLVEKTTEVYTAEDANQTLFVISLTRYHNEPKLKPLPRKKLQEQVVQKMVDSQEGNLLIARKVISLPLPDTLLFTIKNDTILITSCVFTQGKDLFLLSMISRQKDYSQKAFGRFIESFQLVDVPAVKRQPLGNE